MAVYMYINGDFGQKSLKISLKDFYLLIFPTCILDVLHAEKVV